MRAQWTITLFKLTALTTLSGPTISITKLWRVGLSSALTTPRENTSTNTIHGSTAPLVASPHRSRAGTTIATWVTISTRRLSKRSASRPPNAPNRRIGANWSAVVSPTATPLWVRVRINHVSATIWIQLPLSDTIWPTK